MNNPILSKTISLLFVMVAFVIVIGCHRSSQLHTTLKHAESIMEEYPDSAYAMLAPLKVDSTAPEQDRALHALLLALSRYKIGYDDTVAPGLAFSIRYFERKSNDGLRAGKSRWMASIIFQNREMYDSAVVNSMKALEYHDFYSDSFYNGQASRTLGDSFYMLMNYPMCLYWYKEARRQYILSGRDNYIKHSEVDVGRALVCNGKYSDALSLSDTIMSNAIVTKDTSMMVSALRIAGKCYYEEDNFEAAVSTYRQAADLNAVYMNKPEWINYGESLIRTGRLKD